MTFLAESFNSLPEAATHPFAFVAYLFVIVMWTILAWRLNRNSKLLENIEKLPARDRLDALKSEMNTASLQKGLSPEQWLAQKRQSYFFLAFLTLVGAAVVIFVIAATHASSEDKRRAELIGLLHLRETNFLLNLNRLIEQVKIDAEINTSLSDSEYDKTILHSLIAIRDDSADLIDRRTHALENGDLIIAHEIGNKLNMMSERFLVLVEILNESADTLSVHEQLASRIAAIQDLAKDAINNLMHVDER